MKKFKADLHIHSVLSPCANDTEMSPKNIISIAKSKGLDIIAITDHNSMLNCAVCIELGKANDLLVLPGVELNTKEEIHCLAIFEDVNAIDTFQSYINENIVSFKHKPEKMGYQLVVDKDDNIIKQLDHSLFSFLRKGVSEIAEKVHSLNGIVIPAHINRPSNSLLRHLGFIPEDMAVDGMEIYPNIPYTLEDVKKQNFTVLTNSDSHQPEHIGTRYNTCTMKERSFVELKKAIAGVEGRSLVSKFIDYTA